MQDILNFMRMAYTDRRPDILEKIHLKFNGYISKQQMATLKEIHHNQSVFDNLLKYVPLQDYQVKALTECKETFGQMRGMPPLQAIHVIRKRLGYEKALEKTCERLGFRKEYLIGILNTLEEIADGLATMEDFARRLKHLESVLKTSKSRRGQNVVTFSTLHSAKGLEFERVYMIDLIDGIIPSSEDFRDDLATSNKALMEEAARLFYVGMTRAKHHLELIVYRERDGEKVNESIFVLDVKNIVNPPKQVLKKEGIPFNPNAVRDKADLIKGSVVKHRVFGRGSIVEVNEERVHIGFEKGVRVLSVATCLELGLLELVERGGR